MNKREVDRFLEPLKNRPDLNPREEFKRELRNKLSEGQLRNNKRTFIHWVPNLVAAALLLVGVFIGTVLITSDHSQEQLTSGEKLEPPVPDTPITDLTEAEARELIGSAFAHYSVVVNGGGPEIGESFKHDGMDYRFMGDDFLTNESVLSYLQEKYTEKTAVKIFEEIPFIIEDKKLAQPNKFVSGNLQWADGEIQQFKEDGRKTRLVKFKVPVESVDQYQIFDLMLKYENGWKLNEKLPFSYGDNTEADTGTSRGSFNEFRLTDTEQAIYEKFVLDFNEEHLRNLEPLSIAKLYVYAELENNQEALYALYTDKEGYVQWTKEEHLEMSGKENHSKEKTLQVFTGLQDGKFVETEENRGYIEFYNANGMMGFQMVKDEDGIWNVGFTPIQ
jgi:hypothetical protein